MTYPLRIGLLAVVAAIVAAFPTAMVQLYSTDWGTLVNALSSSVVGTTNGGGSSSVLSIALSLAGMVVPIATVFTAGATYLAFEFGMVKMQILWAWLFKFSPL